MTTEMHRTTGRGGWRWPLTAGLLLALELAFLAWLLYHFEYLHGCWEVMREMELKALRVPVWQSLSVMLPVWLVLGLLSHNLMILLVLSLGWRGRG